MGSCILGIDLGTVNSCASVVKDGNAIILGEGADRTIPSCLSIQQGKEVVGRAARRQAVTDPANTVSAVKRLLGHAFESKEVQAARERAPYEIKPSPMGGVLIDVGGRELTPVQISARVLQRIKEAAEQALGESVQSAVISVPAHFNDVQRKATKQAAEYAGLQVLRLINEPTAAAFAYGYRTGKDFTLAVYDLGGGTFDITVLRSEGDKFEVLATDGDSYLGGEDFDHAISSWLEQEFLDEHGSGLEGDPAARLRVKEAVEKAKIELSDVEETRVELPFLTELTDGSRADFSRALTRAKVEELTRPLADRTLELCQRCMDAASIQRMDIEEILLVGGQSRMPVVRAAVREFFGKEARRDINPDEVVAMGAALYGYSLAAEDLREEAEEAAEQSYEIALKETKAARKLLHAVHELKARPENDVDLPRRLAAMIETIDEDQDLPSHSYLPEKRPSDEDLPAAIDQLKSEIRGLHGEAKLAVERLADEPEQPSAEAEPEPEPPEADEPPTDGISLDRFIEDTPQEDATLDRLSDQISELLSDRLDLALDASDDAQKHSDEAEIHANARKVELTDVTSHSLGIASAADLFTVLIGRNQTIPAEHQRNFTTNQDGQREVEIRVCQGRSARASENQLLGTFILEGIAPAARMQPKIEVTFRVDEDGILSVRACDADSGVSQAIRVDDPLGLQQMTAQEAALAAEPAASEDADSAVR